MTGRAPLVRVYWYSQTGQLKETVDAFVGPLADAGWRVDRRQVVPKEDYPFPWSARRFVSVLTEAADRSTVSDVSIEHGGAVEDDRAPDLVVYAFQVWYLAPSVPMRSVLVRFADEFAGVPVIGLTACRNMWYSAAVAVRRQVNQVGGRYLGTVAAIDDAPPAATFVTTLRWLLTGRREPFSVFPRAGVGPEQLARVRAAGEAVAEATADAGGALADRVPGALRRSDAAVVDQTIAAADLLAGRFFGVWARLAKAARPGVPRRLVLVAFLCWLFGSVLFGLPVVALVRKLAGRRFDRALRRALAPVLAAEAKS
ncbi:hypothetical protein ALI144C_19360 [Actinosynnema sp. ALI-1.44]|uniref:hypothetical protein n=1 Tax=Actinosynnema sp. ALI-1.44 TaxID=1933779 RepID=UPI00097C13B5|nr:hypothetical protein [Actinosynnema sp. ALI-1.44]ONI81483.1 hypothetical protein ALI144C_19360 [Actinosynnema sp. ALI-1.44]